MTATVNWSTAARNAAINAVADLFDVGSTNTYAQAWCYTGSMPASTSEAVTGTLIAELDMSDPAWGAASDGSATADTIASGTAVAAGDIGYVRFVDQDETAICDANAGTDDEAVVFNTVTCEIGTPLEITAATLPMAASSVT